MSELWYAEAGIPIESRPDWCAAHRAVEQLSIESFGWHYHDYVDRLSESAVPGEPSASPVEAATVSRAVRDLVHADVDLVRAVLGSQQSGLCALEVAGLRVFVYVSGWGTAPDQPCEAWLRLQSLGVLGAAGFLETRATAALT